MDFLTIKNYCVVLISAMIVCLIFWKFASRNLNRAGNFIVRAYCIAYLAMMIYAAVNGTLLPVHC